MSSFYSALKECILSVKSEELSVKEAVGGPLQEIQLIVIRQVRRTPHEKLFNSLIDRYHYPCCCHPVGAGGE